MAAEKKKLKKNACKKSPRKKKPKVMLDSKKVMLLAASIVFLCAVFLSLSFLFSSPEKNRSRMQQEIAASEKNLQEKKDGAALSEKNPQKMPDKKMQNASVLPSSSEKKESQKGRSAVQLEQKSASIQPKQKEALPQREIPGPEKKQQEAVPSVQEKKASVKSAAVSALEKKRAEELPERYAIPAAKNGATLVFIIDDGGYDVTNLKQYTALPFPVAVAVLPKLAHTADCARAVRNSGQELMLHQPMQAQNLSIYPGEGAILPDMTLSEVYSQVAQNIAELGSGVKGLNNHEGSLITCDVLKIGAVLDAVNDAGMYFVDSRTTAQTQAPQAALERDMKILHRDVFIDDIISRDEMLAQIYRGIGIANKNGTVVMIGHVDKSVRILPALLQDLYPYLKKNGYKFAFPSQIRN